MSSFDPSHPGVLEFAGMVPPGGHCDVDVTCPYEAFRGREIMPHGELSCLKLGRLRLRGSEQLVTSDSLVSAVPLEMFIHSSQSIALDLEALYRSERASVRVYNVSSRTRGFLIELRGVARTSIFKAPAPLLRIVR